MKEIVLALRDSIEGRLKNHVIASVVIAWLFLHSRAILTFLLSTKPEMIVIIKSYELDWCKDIIYPMLFGLGFITIGQYILYIPAHMADLISINISKFSAINARKKFISQRKLNKVKILSEYEYQKTLMLKKVEDVSSKYIALKKENTKLLEELQNSNKINDERAATNRELENKLNSSSGELEQKLNKNNQSLAGIKDSVEFTLQILDSAFSINEPHAQKELIDKARTVISDALSRTPETEPLDFKQTENYRRRWNIPPVVNNEKS